MCTCIPLFCQSKYANAVFIFIHIYIYSDGMGRTGVFITVMSEIERIKFDGEIDIFQTIKAIRVQRPNMVSTGVSVCVRLQIMM